MVSSKQRNKAFTIIAPDTDCAKTYATAMLLKNSVKENNSDTNITSIACKPIQTGSENGKSQDLDFILQTAGITVSPKTYKTLVPCTLKMPASPTLAARMEKKDINIEEITERIIKLSQDYDILFIETAGGIYSPLTSDCKTNADFAKLLGFPVIISIPNRIGAISLAVMTVKSAISEGLIIEGVIFSEITPPKNETERIIFEDNIETFKQMTGIKVISSIKYGELL